MEVLSSAFTFFPLFDQFVNDLQPLVWTFNTFLLVLCLFSGSSFSGYDDTSSDNSTADAANPSAASPEPSAAPGSPPAAAGPHVTAGTPQGQTLGSMQGTHWAPS